MNTGKNKNVPKLKKAVIPAAGEGTRLGQYTAGGSVPKEMLPVLDENNNPIPAIARIYEDLTEDTDVESVMIVTSRTKKAIEDYFDPPLEYADTLRDKGLTKPAEYLRKLADKATIYTTRQKGLPAGTGRPILNAEQYIGDEPFFLLFADEVFAAKPSRAKQMEDAYYKTGGKLIVALKKVGRKDADKYGMAEIYDDVDENRLVKIKSLLEKPGVKNAPSEYGGVGGYILTPNIIPVLKAIAGRIKKNEEVVIADAINELAHSGEEVYGVVIDGDYFDCGSPEKYRQTLDEYPLARGKLQS